LADCDRCKKNGVECSRAGKHPSCDPCTEQRVACFWEGVRKTPKFPRGAKNVSKQAEVVPEAKDDSKGKATKKGKEAKVVKAATTRVAKKAKKEEKVVEPEGEGEEEKSEGEGEVTARVTRAMSKVGMAVDPSGELSTANIEAKEHSDGSRFGGTIVPGLADVYAGQSFLDRRVFTGDLLSGLLVVKEVSNRVIDGIIDEVKKERAVLGMASEWRQTVDVASDADTRVKLGLRASATSPESDGSSLLLPEGADDPKEPSTSKRVSKRISDRKLAKPEKGGKKKKVVESEEE
jgi:hypothetical protein